MRNDQLRVVIDTNLWISFLITKKFIALDSFFIQHKIELLFSEELLNEFLDTTRKPKIKKHFSDRDLNELLEQIGSFSRIVEVKSKVDICRDPNDNFLLALAKDGNAHFLITGDADLLVLGKVHKTTIVTFSDFVKHLK